MEVVSPSISGLALRGEFRSRLGRLLANYCADSGAGDLPYRLPLAGLLGAVQRLLVTNRLVLTDHANDHLRPEANIADDREKALWVLVCWTP